MNQPEFILAESEKTAHMVNRPVSLDRDYLALLADLEGLLKESLQVLSLQDAITVHLQVLVQSVSDQQYLMEVQE